jgi:hypothetical protein
MNVQFLVHRVQMNFDCANAQPQSLGNFSIGKPMQDQSCDLPPALGQRSKPFRFKWPAHNADTAPRKNNPKKCNLQNN